MIGRMTTTSVATTAQRPAAITTSPLPAVTETPALELNHVRVAYGDHVVLPDITLRIASGQLIGVLGPNGSGKTTLMKAVLGLIPIEHGQICVNGLPLSQVCQAVAYISQQGAINTRFPATVADVVMMGRTRLIGWLRRPSARDRVAVAQALVQVKMADLSEASIHELSGGQQQRVFLARALAQEAHLLLLDEPISGVDAPSRETFYTILADLRNAGKTILLSTHDLHERIDRYDNLLLLNHRVVAYGPPSQVFTQPVLEAAYGQQMVTADGKVSTVLSMGGH